MKVCLIILDGWGHNKSKTKHDAIEDSSCINMRRLSKLYPSYLVHASGEHVGLPKNSMGNSEVGHLTIGSGRTIEQYITRINKSLANGTMKDKLDKLLCLKANCIHIVIMISDGGVHSHINHLFGVLDIIKTSFEKIYIHCITYGRDTEPRVALGFINDIKLYAKYNDNCIIATIAGRYYAMDRDNNYNRTDKYFKALTSATEVIKNVETHLQTMYDNMKTDETLEPFRVSKEGVVKEQDLMFFLNFRSDRMRQTVDRFISNGNTIFTMVEYKKEFPVDIIFRQHFIENTLSCVLSSNKIAHIHIAESEKYAHVTYFFNGGREKMNELENRIIIKSPNVSSFDEVPEMSSQEVMEAVICEINNDTPFIVANFAAPDMVGHTGNYNAARVAIEKVDYCVGEIYNHCKKSNYVLIVTADHGNAEIMYDVDSNQISKKHTTNKVPLIMCTNKKTTQIKSQWGFVDSKHTLCDIAPTILRLFGIEIPKEMSGQSLI